MKNLKVKLKEFKTNFYNWSVRVYTKDKNPVFQIHPAWDKKMERTICDIIGQGRGDLMNAQMIAAAPAMHEALTHILEAKEVTKDDLVAIKELLETIEKPNKRYDKFTIEYEMENPVPTNQLNLYFSK